MSGIIGQDLLVKSGMGGFPAGHVLQIKSHYTTQSQTNGGGSASYYIQSNGTWSSSSSSPWGNITTTTINSNIVYILTSTAYFAHNTVSGSFGDWEQFIRYSTNSDLSSPTDTTSLVRVYEDARSTNGTSGQSKYAGGGTFVVGHGVGSGTTIYYTVKSVMAYSGVSNPTTLQVMEVAT